MPFGCLFFIRRMNMPEIKIDVQRTGFPVKIGDLELFFDSSMENLRRFFDYEKIAQNKLKKAQEKASHIHFPKVVDDIRDVDIKTVDAAFDINRELTAIEYDVVFGDGTFAKIYEKYPDILALDNAMEPLFLAISEKIEEQEAARIKQIEDKKNEYLQKKKDKRGD